MKLLRIDKLLVTSMRIFSFFFKFTEEIACAFYVNWKHFYYFIFVIILSEMRHRIHKFFKHFEEFNRCSRCVWHKKNRNCNFYFITSKRLFNVFDEAFNTNLDIQAPHCFNLAFDDVNQTQSCMAKCSDEKRPLEIWRKRYKPFSTASYSSLRSLFCKIVYRHHSCGDRCPTAKRRHPLAETVFVCRSAAPADGFAQPCKIDGKASRQKVGDEPSHIIAKLFFWLFHARSTWPLMVANESNRALSLQGGAA